MSEIAIDSPQPHQRVHDQAVSITGSLASAITPTELSVWCDGECIGTTRLFSPSGFRLLARFPAPFTAEQEVTLSIRAHFSAGEQVLEVPVVIIPARLDQRPYGDVVSPTRDTILHRENIYGFGPPVETPSAEAVKLLLEYLPARSSILDFGCGAGAFGPALIDAGHAWLGAEVQPICIDILKRRRLPFRQLAETETRLPFSDGEFDTAIAIEVLEHIANFEPAIAELARVARSRFLVSVPNIEIIPYFAPLGIVPWHLLESTHVNFFTRASLAAVLGRHFRAVEVFSYGEHPVRTADGVPLHVHLFAVAKK